MIPRKIPRRWFGPGTAAMFVGVAAFATYSYLSASPESQPVRFEAEHNGEFRRISMPIAESSQIRIPVKPEPDRILAARLQLKLTRSQVSRVEAIGKAWTIQKRHLEIAIDGVARRMREQWKSPQSSSDLRPALAGYSELSREFQRRRDIAWSQALAVLDEPQLKTLKSIDPIAGDQK